MKVKATIMIDDDRWAKHPHSVEFDDTECNSKFHTNYVDSCEQYYRAIERAKAAGYDIAPDAEEHFYGIFISLAKLIPTLTPSMSLTFS